MNNELELCDIFSPKAKILILLADLVDKDNTVEEQEFFDILLDLNYEMNILSNYSSRHSARRALSHHLNTLEKEGIIERIYKNGVAHIKLLREPPELNIIKLRRIYNDKVLMSSIFLSFILFVYTIIRFALTEMIIAGVNFLFLMLVFLSFKIKFVY
jgi:DNA-binding transcriptional ArsR family regulator